MRIAVTGAGGFLGWHLRCALHAQGRHEVVPVLREDVAAGRLTALLAGCDAVVHLAGVNRGQDDDVEHGNVELARLLADALPRSGVQVVVHGTSVHAGTDTPFGRGKAVAGQVLARAAAEHGARAVEVVLPNVFGESGRPFYHSFVATFCHQLAAGEVPRIETDRELTLLPAQDAADVLIAAAEGTTPDTVHPGGTRTSVGAVLGELQTMTDYPRTGEFPDLGSPFRVALFSAFQSACFPQHTPLPRQVHADDRGWLVETARAATRETTSFVSTTVPGAVRGQHYHRRKVERFVVLAGTAQIRLRRLFTDHQVTLTVSGEHPQAVDMPPLWAHALRAVGPDPVTTAFWANEVLTPEHTDTYPWAVFGPTEAGDPS